MLDELQINADKPTSYSNILKSLRKKRALN